MRIQSTNGRSVTFLHEKVIKKSSKKKIPIHIPNKRTTCQRFYFLYNVINIKSMRFRRNNFSEIT